MNIEGLSYEEIFFVCTEASPCTDIYMKNVSQLSAVTSSIKYTNTYSISAEGKTFDSHLSDHYGVQVKVPLR